MAKLEALDNRLLDVHTSQPGRVVKYYADTYEADIQLVCRRAVPHVDGGYVYEDPPVLPKVPLACWGTTDSYFKPPVTAGAFVWFFASEVSTDEFLETGDVSQPANVARHSLSSGIAIPFVLPSEIPTGPMLQAGSGGDFVARADKVDARCKAIEDWGAKHTHKIAAMPGPPGLESMLAVQPLVPGSSTAASEIKVK